ncbi:MAG: hypothetical protein HY319_31710 [Armatimonadetes bacterium]|nr:hypothetical protein [Armatimonadota bacterium]
MEFLWQYAYRPLPSGGLPAPLLPLRLVLGDYRVDFLALLDTGAEQTLLDGIHLRAAGIDIFRGSAKRFQGFLGAGAAAYEHPSILLLEDLELGLPLAYSAFPLPRQVLGRDVMSHLTVALRERSLELFVTPEG